MESDDEIDIEGDFDISARGSADVLEDPNELPSKLALFQEEIPHPWTLEQGWPVDQYADESSRALMEKMLLEEQHYFGGAMLQKDSGSFEKNSDRKLSKLSSMSKTCAGKRLWKKWTKEESDLFVKGLEIFGKKWKKIADIIPSRTYEQVKKYGQKYILDLDNHGNIESSERSSVLTDKIEGTHNRIDTGELTINVLKGKGRKRQFISKASGIQGRSPEVQNTKGTMFPDAQLVRITRESGSDSEEIDVEDNETKEPLSQPGLHIGKYNKEEGPETDNQSKVNVKSNGINQTVDSRILVDIKQADTKSSISPCATNQTSSVGCKKQKAHVNNEFTTVCRTFCQTYHTVNTENSMEIEYSKNEFPSVSNMSCSKNQSSKNKTVCNDEVNTINESKGYMVVDSSVVSECVHNPTLSHKKESNHNPGHGELENDSNTETVVDKDVQTEECIDEFDTELQGNRQDGPDGSSEDEHPNEFPIQGSDGKICYLPDPTEECAIDPSDISLQETQIFAEFFDGRKNDKSATKYREIRNCILTTWNKVKPSFLSKTVMRTGLKKIKCDVNLIGRIHAYLEQIGAINYGCEQVQYKNKKKHIRKLNGARKYPHVLNNYKKDVLSKRRRKVRDMFGTWVEEKEFEGRTIDHDKNKVSTTETVKCKNKTNSPYDPFKLIPCQKFGSLFEAPFEVEIDITALILMDVHSHLSKTEVIGLLGGQYNKDIGVLKVSVVEPCDSLSTGMQCEMDPVSQTIASEKISSSGMKIVGWYHSHPSFEPNPSVRDIETQENFQMWFSFDKNPFIGIIVSPYCQSSSPFLSLIRCLIISRHTSVCSNLGLPFQFNHKVVHNDRNFELLLEKIESLISKNVQSKSKVEMMLCFKQGLAVTCMDKLCRSLSQYFSAVEATVQKNLFLEQLCTVIKQYYTVT